MLTLSDARKGFFFVFVCSVALLLLHAVNLAWATAASPRFQHLDLEQGLSQSSALALAQDHFGFLWIGTYDGLNRYDGRKVQIYRSVQGDPTSLPDNNIRVLSVQPDGTLLVGTRNGGLVAYDQAADAFRPYPADHPCPEKEIRGLARDRDGVLWVAGNNGLIACDASGNWSKPVPLPVSAKEADTGPVVAVRCDARGDTYAATPNAVYRIARSSGQAQRIGPDAAQPATSEAAISGLNFQDEGTLWVLTENAGAYRLSLSSGTWAHFLGEVATSFAFLDSRGELYVGTNKGLAKLFPSPETPGDLRAVLYAHDGADPESLSHDDVLSMMEDAGGVLWVGTYSGGLNKLSPAYQAFACLRSERGNPTSLSGNGVSAVLPQGNDRLWVGTRYHGLNLVDRTTGGVRHFHHNPADPRSIGDDGINSLHLDRKGRLWIGTMDNGLDRYDPADGTFVHYRSDPDDPETLSQNKIWWIAEDAAGIFWLGTSSGGLNRFDPETGQVKRYKHDPNDPSSISHNRVRHITIGPDGLLWIGTNAGLNRFDPKTERFIHWEHDPSDARSLSNNRVTPILVQPDGRLWVGTDSGLNHFDPQTGLFRRVTVEDGLANDGIQGILPDTVGNLWLSTFRGLSRYTPATGEVRNFSDRDGLPGLEFWMNAYAAGPSGEMYFGSVKGIAAFQPQRIKANSHAPPVAITDLSVLNQPYRAAGNAVVASSVAIAYKDNTVSFRFAALDFVDPSRNRFSHKLEGFDTAFSPPTTDPTATYTNLDPGRYVLRVTACNNDGLWNTKEAAWSCTSCRPTGKLGGFARCWRCSSCAFFLRPTIRASRSSSGGGSNSKTSCGSAPRIWKTASWSATPPRRPCGKANGAFRPSSRIRPWPSASAPWRRERCCASTRPLPVSPGIRWTTSAPSPARKCTSGTIPSAGSASWPRFAAIRPPSIGRWPLRFRPTAA